MRRSVVEVHNTLLDLQRSVLRNKYDLKKEVRS
jgi:hypothetical protein